MYELLLVAAFGLFGLWQTRLRDQEEDDITRKVGDRIGKLWDIAHQGMRENRFLRAEKALLTILKIDEVTSTCRPYDNNKEVLRLEATRISKVAKILRKPPKCPVLSLI